MNDVHVLPNGPTSVSAARLLTLSMPVGIVRNWSEGQILTFNVLSVHDDGTVRLSIGRETLTARQEHGFVLRPGQRVAMRIEHIGQTVIRLRILANPTEGLARAWRVALASSLPLDRTIALLATQAATAHASKVKETPQCWLLRLLDTLPTPTGLARPAGFRQAFDESGLFLEAKLAAGLSVSTTDFKVQWLRLAQRLRDWFTALDREADPVTAPNRESTMNLLRYIEGALARIQLEQLATLAASREGAQVWIGALPWRDENGYGVLRLRIEPEETGRWSGSRRHTEPETWKAWLHFEPPGLGPMHACVRVRGRLVEVEFWVECAAIAQRLHDHLVVLRAELEAAGLEIGSLGCHPGAPPDGPRDTPIPPFPLFNETV